MPYLLDVILTNSKIPCINTLNFTTGVIDCNKVISTIFNKTNPNIDKAKLTFRSFRSFDNAFLEEIAKYTASKFKYMRDSDQVNNVNNQYENDFVNTIDRHAHSENWPRGFKT